jgi:hypothetical protein
MEKPGLGKIKWDGDDSEVGFGKIRAAKSRSVLGSMRSGGGETTKPLSTLNAKLATSLGISNKARQAIEASGMDDQAVTAMLSRLTKKQLENLSTE